MKHTILFAFAMTIICASSCVSQVVAQIETAVEKVESFNMANSSMIGKRPPLAGVKGTPYLEEEWRQAEILTRDGQLVQEVKVMLNTYDNEVEMQKGGRHLRLPSYTIDHIKITSGKTYISIENNFPTLYLEGFMEIVQQLDTVAVYRRLYCYKKDPTYVEGVGVGSRDYELIHKEEMYIARGRKAARIFNSHRKNIKALRAIGIDYEKSSKFKLSSMEAVQQYLARM